MLRSVCRFHRGFTIGTLQPGVTELVLHAALPTPEAQAIMPDSAARFGRAYAEAYGVIYAGPDGDSRLLAQGAGLVDLALRAGQSPAAVRAS